MPEAEKESVESLHIVSIHIKFQRTAYARLRFGIGGDFARGHQVDYVLGSWSDEERKALPERLKVFAEAVLSFATIGAERTMNLYHKR